MSILCFFSPGERLGETTYDEGVPLTGEDLDRVDNDRRVVDCISLNDRHIVSVDREGEVRVAGHSDEAETVALALGDIEYGEIARVTTGETAKTVDQCRISATTVPQVHGEYDMLDCVYFEATHGKALPRRAAVWYQSDSVITVVSSSTS